MSKKTQTPNHSREEHTSESETESLTVSRDIDKLLAKSEFRKLVLVMCKSIYRRLSLGGYDPSYTAEDLFGDACLKLLKSRNSLQRADIPNEKALARFLYALIFNRALSKIREIKRQRPRVFTRETVEDMPEEESGFNLFREWLARELMEFTKSLPKERRRVLELWLEENSYREIVQQLDSEGVHVSHVTVQRWLDADLRFLRAKAS